MEVYGGGMGMGSKGDKACYTKHAQSLLYSTSSPVSTYQLGDGLHVHENSRGSVDVGDGDGLVLDSRRESICHLNHGEVWAVRTMGKWAV